MTKLEGQVSKIIEELVTQPEVLALAISRHQQEDDREIHAENIVKAKDNLARIENELSSAIQLQIMAHTKGLPPAVYEDAVLRLVEKREQCAKEIEQLDQRSTALANLGNGQLQRQHLMNQLREDVVCALNPPYVPPGEKRQMLSRLISSVYPDGDEVEVYLHPNIFDDGVTWVYKRNEDCSYSWRITQI